MRIVHHFHDFIVIHSFAQLSCCDFHFLEINVPASIVIVQGEYTLEAIDCFAISQSAVNNFQKFLEVDGPIFGLKVIYHVEDDLISFIEAELLKDFLNLFGIDFSAIVLIEEIEGRFELFNFLFREAFFGRHDFRL